MEKFYIIYINPTQHKSNRFHIYSVTSSVYYLFSNVLRIIFIARFNFWRLDEGFCHSIEVHGILLVVSSSLRGMTSSYWEIISLLYSIVTQS